MTSEESQEYSVVIATMDRPEALVRVLECLEQQSVLPQCVVIVDASENQRTRELVEQSCWSKLGMRYLCAEVRSAAQQRNQGAREVDTDYIVFMDDDIAFESDFIERLLDGFRKPSSRPVGGVSGRMEGSTHAKPGSLLRFYYWLQAGYSHPHYGGQLFGPAINTFPCYAEQHENLIEAQWLNSGCVMFLRKAFSAVMFPDFEGYSHMEDAYASARIAKDYSLYYHSGAVYQHFPSDSAAKRDRYELARMRVRNQRRLAQDVMEVPPVALRWKMLLHKLFVIFYLLRTRPPGWTSEARGTWVG